MLTDSDADGFTRSPPFGERRVWEIGAIGNDFYIGEYRKLPFEAQICSNGMMKKVNTTNKFKSRDQQTFALRAVSELLSVFSGSDFEDLSQSEPVADVYFTPELQAKIDAGELIE